MSSTPCESAALDRLIERWVARIATSSATTVEAIVANAENVRAAVQELKRYGQKARRLLAARSGLSRPMMSKLETIGRHAELLRRRTATLPPSVSSLYALARMPSPQLEQAVMMDLRGKSRAEIEALFAEPAAPKPRRKLMTISLADDLEEPARRALIADITAALARIAQDHGTGIEVSSIAGGTKSADEPGARQAPDAPEQVAPPQDRRRDELPDARGADDAGQEVVEPLRFFTGENPAGRRTGAAHGHRPADPGRDSGQPPLRKTGKSEPSPGLAPSAAFAREREDIRQRIARLEERLMRPSGQGSSSGHAVPPQVRWPSPRAARSSSGELSFSGRGASR